MRNVVLWWVLIISLASNLLLLVLVQDARNQRLYERFRILSYMTHFSIVIKAGGCLSVEDITKSGRIVPSIKHDDGFSDMTMKNEFGLRYVFNKRACLTEIRAVPEVHIDEFK